MIEPTSMAEPLAPAEAPPLAAALVPGGGVLAAGAELGPAPAPLLELLLQAAAARTTAAAAPTVAARSARRARPRAPPAVPVLDLCMSLAFR